MHPVSAVLIMRDPSIYLLTSGRAGLGLSDPLDCNSYLLVQDGRSILVDAGAGDAAARALLTLSRESGVPLPDHILVTHGHADHSGGITAIRALGHRVNVWAGAALKTLMERDPDPVAIDRARRAGVYPPDYAWQPPMVDRWLEGGEVLDVDGVVVEAVATPGHTPEHTAYVARTPGGGAALFSGDHLYPGGRIALEPIPGCDVMAYAQSMERLGAHTYQALLPGHLMPVLDDRGRSVRLAHERFARLDVPRNLGDVWESERRGPTE